MNKTELRKLIREEVKNTLNEATYPITVSLVYAVGNKLIITIGNSQVSVAGYEPSPEDKKAIDDIMITHNAKPVTFKTSNKYDGLHYQVKDGSWMTMNGLVSMRKKIEALNLTYTNR